MDAQTYTICQGCRDELHPDAPDAVRAVEMVPVPGQGAAAHDRAEGIGVLFHDYCYPEGAPDYKRV